MNSPFKNKYRFADFVLDTSKRLLLKDGKPVALNSKTLDLLEALIEREGDVITKDELLESIWAGQFVEESNLTVQISTLRKVLGETRGENRFIVTVPGKGYKFIGESDYGPDEITIENHSYSSIVVEEIEDSDEFIERRRPLLPPARRSWLGRNGFAAGTLAVLLIVTATAGAYWLRARSSPLPFAKTQIRQLTNKGNITLAALSPDGNLFAYVTNEFGKESLWAGQINGGDNIMLRPPAETEYFKLAFSPDNDKLFFSNKDWAAESSTLNKIPVFGGAAEKISDDVRFFALSADGLSIATTKYDTDLARDDLFVIDLASKQGKRLTLPSTRIAFASLSFSPDGQRLAFATTSSELSQLLFAVRISDSSVEQLSMYEFGQIKNTVWLADSSAVILSALETQTWSAVPQFRVWSVALGGGETRKITTDLSSYGDALGVATDSLLTIESRQLNNIWVAPADNLASAKQVTTGSFGRYDGLWGLDWTPDGHIVFNSSDTQSQVISMMNADGSGQKRLTAPGFVESDLDVSQDGRYIVFHSTRGGGGFDIWRMNANGEKAQQLTFDKQSYQPFISPDSRFVYYKSMADGIGSLFRVSIDGGDTVRLTDKETSWGSISPDDRFIAALYKTDKPRLAIFDINSGLQLKQFDLPKTATVYGGMRWTPDGGSIIYHDYDFGYWQQNAIGGEPERIKNLPKEKLYNFAWSNDGRQFAYVRGQEIRDVVLFRDLK